MRRLILCLPLLLCSPCAADVLRASIDGPMSARIGDLIVLTAERSTGVKSYKWKCIPDVQEGLMEIDGGKRVAFSRPEGGRFTFVLATASADGEVDVDLHTIIVGDGEPAATNPGTAGRSDPGKLAKQWLSKVPASATRDAERKILAGTLRQMAALVDQEKVDTPEELAQALAFSAQSAMGDGFARWQEFFNAFGKWLDESREVGTIDTLEEFRDVYLQLAKGLE